MPVNKTIKRTLGQIPFTQVPNDVIQNLGDATAIAIYVYLLSKPENWTVRKKDIMESLGIGEYKYRAGRKILSDAGLWTNAKIHDENGRLQGSIIWISALPTEVLIADVSINRLVGVPTCRATNTLSNKEKSLKRKITKKKERARKRATTIPEDYWPKQEDLLAMREKVRNIEFGTETDKFKNYYAATGRPMKDWTACWRNWIIKAGQYVEQRA